MSSSPSVSLPFPEYFSALAANYAKQTGDSTRLIFAGVYDEIVSSHPISSKSIVHDNAAGPGTATSVIIDRSSDTPNILVTDNEPAMVSAAKDAFKKFPSANVGQADSLNLKSVESGSISHSILNFSIFAMGDPKKCLQEIHRTLAPDGVAVVLTWKRFAAGELVHAVQEIIRPDLPKLPLPHPEFMQEGVLVDAMVEAGFEKDKMRVLTKKLIIKDGNFEGLKGFMLSDFTKPARAGYTDEEVGGWPEAVDKVVSEEVKKEGGVRFEAWVVLSAK